MCASGWLSSRWRLGWGDPTGFYDERGDLIGGRQDGRAEARAGSVRGRDGTERDGMGTTACTDTLTVMHRHPEIHCVMHRYAKHAPTRAEGRATALLRPCTLSLKLPS